MNSIYEELESLEAEYDQLEDEVSDYEDRVDELVDENEDIELELQKLAERIQELKTALSSNNSELTSIRKILPTKKKEMELLEKKIEKKKSLAQETRLKEHLSKIKRIKSDACYVQGLYSDTYTVDLLDDYVSSEKEFLVLRNQFYLKYNSTSISLIVSRRNYELDVNATKPTMTELKQNSGKSIYWVNTYRLSPLINELKEIDSQPNSLKNGSIYAFSKPFLLGGQTSYNRTNYGCEWIGGGDYIEKTLYGDVTDFMIVGFFVGNKW